MRIIAGQFKGRRLTSFSASHIRPTTDRVKETLFNILMHDIPDAVVLDLFAGTGNLGLEALSRGARNVVFVENNRKSLEILQKNIQLLNVGEQAELCSIDVMKFLKRPAEPTFDVVFIDPPFTEKMAHQVLQRLTEATMLKAGAKIIIEASRHEQVDPQYAKLSLLDRRDFGDKSAFIFIYGESANRSSK